MTQPHKHTQRLRELLARPGIVHAMGAHDVFSALLMEQAGVELVFLGGFGTGASMLGLPDLGYLTMTEMAEATRRTAARLSVPVIADADTGYGDLPQIARTVASFAQAGAAGLLLEDQVNPKRCGHFGGKEVIARDEMITKIRTAVAAKPDPEFVIIARTDAREPLGLDEAIERANRYCDAGADLAFIEAPESADELQAIATDVPHPMLANMLTGGKTPILSVRELGEIGYKIAVCPIESLLVSARAIQDLCRTWLKDGRVDRMAEAALTFSDLKRILQVDEHLRSPGSDAPEAGGRT